MDRTNTIQLLFCFGDPWASIRIPCFFFRYSSFNQRWGYDLLELCLQGPEVCSLFLQKNSWKCGVDLMKWYLYNHGWFGDMLNYMICIYNNVHLYIYGSWLRQSSRRCLLIWLVACHKLFGYHATRLYSSYPGKSLGALFLSLLNQLPPPLKLQKVAYPLGSMHGICIFIYMNIDVSDKCR